MPDTQNTETPAVAVEQEQEAVLPSSYDGSRWRAPSHRRAAAIEAAYILEAVRK